MGALCEWPGCQAMAEGTTGSPWWFSCRDHVGRLRPGDDERARIVAEATDALTAERDRLKLEVEAFRKALEALLIVRRMQSPEPLPLDCLVLCNAALGAAKPHTCPESDPGPEDITLAKDCLACIALGAAK